MNLHDESRDTAGAPQGPPPGAGLMNVLRWVLFAFLLALAVASLASYVAWRHETASPHGAAAQEVWQCPMHPQITADRPGECPVCGMKLVRVAATPAPRRGAGAGVPGLATVEIGPERVQQIGVRTAIVTRGEVGDPLDLVGFVTPDETRLRRVQVRAAGWVRELRVDHTGERVTAGQPLLTIYSPELYQAEQEYVIARGAEPGATHMGMGDAPVAAASRLRLLGVPDEEVRRIDREGTPSDRVLLRAPAGGTVLERGAVEGQYVDAGTPLLSLADLSRVWVLADLYEMDAARIRVGDRATFTAGALPGRTFAGRIELILPTVSNETRTLKARLSLANADGALRPGMYGRVRTEGRGGAGLSLPEEAVVRAGERTYVFLARAGGRFEPRIVRLGGAAGDRVVVLDGVAEGDTVVASASFLIDSESRLKAAIEGMGAGGGAAK